MLKSLKSWAHARLDERTSWNGGALIAVGIIALIAKPLIGLAAWAAIIYGAYQVWKAEDK